MNPFRVFTLLFCLVAGILPAQRPADSGGNATLTWDYSAVSQLTRGSARLGDFSAARVGLSAVTHVAKLGEWQLSAGLDYQRLELIHSGGGQLPNSLHTLAGRVSVARQWNRRWSTDFDMRPGVYSDLEDISGDDLNLPASLRIAYFVNPQLQLVAGFRVDWRNEIPIVGGPGLRWTFAPDWTLNLFLPAPNITWQCSDRLTLIAGGELTGGSFRVHERYGTDVGDPRLNNSQLSYRELRASLGLHWRLSERAELRASAGVALDRRATYNEQRLQFTSAPAPFTQLRYTFRF